MKNEEEASLLTEHLLDKAVKKIWRHSESEVVIEFKDGSTFIIDSIENKLEFSITSSKG
jgi:hypothetical protein